MSKRSASEISKDAGNEERDTPVVIVHDDNESHQRVLHPESSSLLDDMLYPLSCDEFLKQHFRKNAVCIQRRPHTSEPDAGDDNKMVSSICNEYLFGLDVRQIFAETSSENVFLWLRPPSNSSSNTLNSVEIADADTAYALHQSGSHPAYCRAPPILEQLLVKSLLRSTGLGAGHYHPPHSETVTLGGGTTLGRGEVELFIGAKQSEQSTNGTKETKKHTTGAHTDFQENFTIQLSGVKQWTLRRGRVRHPLRATTPHYCRDATVIENQLKVGRLCMAGEDTAANKGNYGFEYNDNNAYGPEETITLHPGDVLYFPSGMWHTVKTIEPGVSLNVSLMGTTYATLACEALQHILVSDERWREVVTSRPGDVYGAKRLHQLMKGLSKTIDNFVANGGAAHVLPPGELVMCVILLCLLFTKSTVPHVAVLLYIALCYPPEEKEDKSDCDEDENSSAAESIDDIECKNQDDVQQSDCLLVDMDTFEGPSGWKCEKLPGAKLVKNPLATLIAKDDVTSHIQSEENELEQHRKQYILNLNFAGNEMFESHIRLILATEQYSDLMDHCVLGDMHLVKDEIPDCLFYYGLFAWAT